MTPVDDIISENQRRLQHLSQPFNPITGQGSTGPRRQVRIRDFPTPVMHLPEEMFAEQLLADILKARTLRNYMRLHAIPYTPQNLDTLIEAFIRLRCRYDFPFWCAVFVKIKPKGGGDDIPFILNRPQRRLVEEGFHNLNILHAPLRLIILKARQWGGSTCTDIFFGWLQLVHGIGLNSLIVAQVKDAANEVLDMFYRMILAYPATMLHPLGQPAPPDETKWAGVGNTANIHRVPQRKCKVKIASVEKPDSCRGGDYNLVHCTEVGVWKKTEGKEPEDIIDAATGGMLLAPLTAIVYESTAKGTGNFFHREWTAARNGDSQFTTIFVPWYQIDQYALPFATPAEQSAFAARLYKHRLSDNTLTDREESGRYLWSLWQRGATLQAIHWYVAERRKYRDFGHMASEYPSDDIEAFVHSGARVFDIYQVNAFRPDCCKPRHVGDVTGAALTGPDSLRRLRFRPDRQGILWVWQLPETFPDCRVAYRYLVTVDIGGRSRKADFSVITVLDRYEMIEAGLPAIVAQWRGHIDHDLLAWKAAQIAAFYDNALLVIESNTLETKDRDRTVDADQSGFILNRIKDAYSNLYARPSTPQEAVTPAAETRYGFHTNTKTKPEIISNLIECVRDHLYIERDERALDEYLTYELKDGAYNAITGHHDDILMTRAIALWISYREMPRPCFVPNTPQAYTTAAPI